MSRFRILRFAFAAFVVPASHVAAGELLQHATSPLVIPTYEGSGQAVEPDVLWIPGGWHGYEYWMVVTPYPCGDETKENPSILAGHDEQNWEVPAVDGETAPSPLVGSSEPCFGYAYVNNDPAIVLVGDSLFVYYEVTHLSGLERNTTDIKRLASADGVHWTSGDDAPVVLSKGNYILSPTVVYNDGVYRMWYVRTWYCGEQNVEIHERTSSDGLVWPDADDQIAQIDQPHGIPFHLTVKHVGGVYAMVYVAYPFGSDCGQWKSLFYAESVDGANWHAFDRPLLTATDRPSDWDGRGIYRSGFVGRYPNMAVWYSARGDSSCGLCDGRSGPLWHVGFTSMGEYRTPVAIASGSGPVTFATSIEGAPSPESELLIANYAPAGASDVTYTIETSPGFSVDPAGDFTLSPGGTNHHVLRMAAGTSGHKSGTATLLAGDPRHARAALALSGNVLRHSVPSLDPVAITWNDILDFGRHARGQFAPRATSVFNVDYDSLQARLSIQSASLSGGDGRFSIEGGFEPALVAGQGRTLRLRFDDTGAARESTYNATLVLATADESLPGAASQSPITLTLLARVTGSGPIDPGGEPALTPTRLYPVYPNPVAGAATVRFDLARATRARIELFDLQGRRVATLADEWLGPGSHQAPWDGRSEGGGSAGSGVFLVRMSGAGIPTATTRFVLVR